MRDKQLRLGSITILFTVVVLCVATLAVLAVTTAQADQAVAQKYADQVQSIYAAETAGHQWLAETHAALCGEGALPAGSVQQGDRVTTTLELDNGRVLTIALELTGDGGYRIVQWQNTARWEQDTTLDVWNGGLLGAQGGDE